MASNTYPVAVIGMAVNLPAAKTCDEFWSMMMNGEESVGRFPRQRANDIQHVLQLFRSELLDAKKPFFTGSFFKEVDKFDPSVFQISEKEALYIEPEQRFFLETVWAVLEDAGYASKIRGSKTGIYVGNTVNKYKYILTENHPSISHGNHSPFIAARVSYVLDLKGPAMMVATGSSSSLLAVHIACQGLLSGDCDMAISGGITLDLLPISTHTDIWNQLGITGSDVKCRPFDRLANGIAKGEGCGAVMLKPLAKAIADGDTVYGVLQGTTTNQDGHSNGITAPHPGAQTSMLVQAWKLANITPDKISFFEAHGTGTELGDQIEISGITNAFKSLGQTFNCQSKGKIPIGSVKANVGHLADGAAGIVGLIKVLLCYKYNMIPPMVHFKEPNPHINWPASPVFINTTPVHLAPHKKSEPIFISLSAFGLLGTNVHAVVRSHTPFVQVMDITPEIPFDIQNETQYLALAANSKRSLCELARKFCNYFKSEVNEKNCLKLKNVCYTINTGREQNRFEHRAIVIGSDWNEMSKNLERLFCCLNQEFDDVKSPLSNSFQKNDGYVIAYDGIVVNHEMKSFDSEKGQLILSFINGKSVPWDKYYSSSDKLTKIPLLPTYAFEKIRFWPSSSSNQPLNAKHLTLEHGTIGNQKEACTPFMNEPDLHVLPKKSIETAIQAALNEVLSLDIDWSEHASEDLFSYGLDSFISTQLNMMIKKDFGINFSMRGFHLNPTYLGLKSMIEEELEIKRSKKTECVTKVLSPKINPVESHSVSFSQQRLWVLQELTGNHSVYNATNCLKITGEFHVPAFVASVNSVLSSHDAFRIIFNENNGKLSQRFDEKMLIFVKETNIKALGEESCKTVMKLYSQDYKTPFNLQSGPLVRCVLYHLPDGTHYFTMVIHHIIFDGWSHFLFYNELWDKYKLLINGSAIDSQLKLPLFIKLADEDYTSSHTEDLIYWKTVLSGDLPLTTLPGDKKRPAVFTHNGSRLSCTIDNADIQSLLLLCSSKNTMFMILLSVVYTLIHSFTGEEDLIIGSPIAGRTHANLKHVIGCFVNTLALRLQLESKFTFEDVLENVSKMVLEALDHQSLPFDYLVNELNLSQDTSVTPVFSINVCYHNTEIKSEHVDPPIETKVEQILLHNDTAKWDLYFDFLLGDHGMTFTLEYYQDVFSDCYAKHIFDTFLHLLKILTSQPSISLQHAFNHSAASILHGNIKNLHNVSLTDQLLESLKRNSDQSCIIDCCGKRHTYGNIMQDVKMLSVFLRETCMMKKQDRIGLLLGPSLESLKSVLACIFSGLVYVPLSQDNPGHRLVYICKQSQLKAVIFQKSSLALANHLLWSCTTINTLICVDSDQFFGLKETDDVPLMNTELWCSVATSASNDIEGGGWKSSYTGEFMSTEEMNEYSQNVLLKLRSYLTSSSQVLEIGCASGLTTKVISPLVLRYVATDLSQAMIDRLKKQITDRDNIETVCVSADEVAHKFNGQQFDVIILNSIVHCFPGHNYLVKVFDACESLMTENGVIFIGDIMDFDLKERLIHSLWAFKAKNPPKKVKTEWDNELFLSKDFLHFLCKRSMKFNSISFSKKIYTIPNELTEYRFDAIFSAKESLLSFSNQPKFYALNDITDYSQKIGIDSLHENFLKIVHEVEYSDQAYILFTSGTTGTPKGVTISCSALVNYVQWATKAYEFDRKSVIPFFSPLTFDFTVTCIFPPLISGSTIFIFNSFQQGCSDIISCKEITTMKVSPLQLDALLATAGKPLSASRFIISGEELTHILLNKLKCNKTNDKFQVWNEYGPTEATVGCIVKHFHSDKLPLNRNEFVPIGQPIDNVIISVVRENHDPVCIGSKGRLCIGGKCLCSDIIGSNANRTMLAAATWGTPGEMMLLTDDMVQMLPDTSELLYYGRIGDSNIAKINDIRVDLMEVQNVIEASSLVSSAWVTIFEYKSYTYMGAAMIPKEISGELSLEEEIKKTISANLPKAFIPKVFIIISQPPITVNGKKDSILLRKLFVSHMDFLSQSTIDEALLDTDIVVKLQNIWKSILPIARIPNPEENFFFDLRGDSLQAIYLVRKLRDEGYQVNISDIFTYPSIKQLSPIIAQRSHKEQTESEPAIFFRPTPIVEEFLVNCEANQFSLSALLHFNIRIETDILDKALKSIANKHISLHSRFEVNNGIALQEVVDITDEHISITEIDIYKKRESDELIKEPEFWALCEKLERNHSLTKGILLNAAIIDYYTELESSNHAYYVLIVVHHIAVDILSWQQILSDLSLSLQLLSKDKSHVPTLPNCITPFSAFCRALHKESFESEIQYWKGIEALYPENKIQSHGTFESARWCNVTLDYSVVASVTSALQCSDEALLLTMFGRSMSLIYNRDKNIITLESHGRQLHSIDSTDTVGRCACKFPFVLDTSAYGNPVEQIKLTQESKINMPNQGLGFGVLKCSGKISMNFPEVMFVFQGHLDTPINQYFDGGTFKFEQIPWLETLCDELQHNNFHRQQSDTLQFDMEIISWIYQGQLKFGCLYDSTVVTRETVQNFLDMTILNIKLLATNLPKTVKVDIEVLSSIAITSECETIIKECLLKHGVLVEELLLHPPNQIIQQLNQGHYNKHGKIIVLISRFQNQQEAQDFVQSCTASNYFKYTENVVIINADTIHNSVKFSMDRAIRSAMVCTLPEYISNSYYEPDTDACCGLPFNQDGYEHFGLHIARVIRGKVSKTKYKVIAVDTDYTLWNGECAEGEVSLNEANTVLHNFLLKKKLEGMLLVVLSKNQLSDVEHAFEHIMKKPLTRNDFVTIVANWRPKTSNIAHIAKMFNLGLDSFVFIDDSFLECEQMQNFCPDVLTLQFPAMKEMASALLDNLWVLDNFNPTLESAKEYLGADTTSLEHASFSQTEYSGLSELHTLIESTWSPMQKLIANHHNLFPIIPASPILLKKEKPVRTDSMSSISRLESDLKSAWMDILHTKLEPEYSDDFLKCGGDSFDAVFLVSRLQRISNIEISIMDLFQAPQYGLFRKAVLNAPKIKIADDIASCDSKTAIVENGVSLSFSQQRMVIMQLTTPQSSAYTETIAIKSKTNISPNLIFKSLTHIHPILKLKIKMEESYVMYIERNFEIECDIETVLDIETAQKIMSESIPAMNILSEALVKFRCFNLDKGGVVLAIHIHHVLADEVTLTKIAKSLNELCQDTDLVSTPSMQSKKAEYAEFVKDEQMYMKSQQCIDDCKFWTSYFNSLPPNVSLSILPETESTWTNTAIYQAKHKEVSIPKLVQDKIATYCTHAGITPCHYFLACTILVLHKYFGVNLVNLAIPVTMRTDLNRESDGLYINTVLFKASIDTSSYLSEHIQNISKTWLQVQDHSQYPLDQVVKMLWKQHERSSNSFCCTMFNYSSNPKFNFKNSIKVSSKHAKMPLSIDIFNCIESLNLCIEWAPELIQNSILENLTNSLIKLYCNAFNFAEQPIQNFDLLSTDEYDLISSFESGGKVTSMTNTIISTFEEYSRVYSDEIAVICEKNTLTYAQLNEIAINLAYDLISKVGKKKIKERPVIIVMARDEYAIASVVGVWKAGGHFLPVSISNQTSFTDILEQTNPSAIVLSTPIKSVPMLEKIKSTILIPVVDIRKISRISASSTVAVTRNEDDIAYIIRTSGSTGRPKLCKVSQRSISLLSSAWKFEYKMDDFQVVVLQWAPLSFDVFIGDLVRGLFSAPGRLVICPDKFRLDVHYVMNLIATNNVTISEVTPQFGYQLVLSAGKNELESLKLLILGSDVLHCHTYKKVRSLLHKHQRLINSYGMTEATIDSSFFESDTEELPVTRSGAIPIGKPLPGVTFHILDSKTLQVCPIGTVGELFISGDILASGDAEIIQLKSINKKALRTRDAACWLPCGNVDLIGRLDNMVKLRGFRISTTEVENKIVQHVYGVKDVCIALKRGTAKETEFLCAFLVLNKGVDHTSINKINVHNQLRSHLPYYMLPDFVHVLKEIPLTENGKVHHNALPSLSQLLKSHEMISSRMPISPTALKLKSLLASSFGLSDSSGINCDLTFMEQGANSLVLIQFSSLIATDTTFNVNIADIFSYPTVNALADFIDSSGDSKQMNDDFCTALTKKITHTPEVEIAITGLGLRLPGKVMSLPQLWEVLQNGKDLIADFPSIRANDAKKCINSSTASLINTDTFQGAFLDRIDKFDHHFFQILPGEAKFMAPEQRLFLQVATEALSEAIGLNELKGSKIGVFIGSSEVGYSHLERPNEPIAIAGSMPGMIATRVAYQWNLKGPTMLVDTACSSSLVALKLACESIKRSECVGALVGGISITMYPSLAGVFRNASILSPNFHCKPFDKHADGTAVGEGVLCLFLEPLSQALARKKHIYGIVKSAESNSVGHGNGITAPSAISQEGVIENAIKAASIDKSDISYIECHGSGTKIGDKIELTALSSVFSGIEVKKMPIGSVKSIFGHLDAASGLLSVFKVIASMMFNKIPPTANFASPHQELVNSCLSVINSTKQWNNDGAKSRIAGISAFGMTGTNCHVVLSESGHAYEYPENIKFEPPLFFSGANILQIKQQISIYSNYIKFMVIDGVTLLSSMCYTVATRLKELNTMGIGHEQFRMAVSAKNPESTLKLLNILASCKDLNDMIKLAVNRNDVHAFSQEFSESVFSNSATTHFQTFLRSGTIDITIFGNSVRPAPGIVVPMYSESSHWLDPIAQPLQSVPERKLLHTFRDIIMDTRELIRTLNFEPTEELLDLQNRFCCSIIIQYFLTTDLAPCMKNSENLTFIEAFEQSKMLGKYEKLFFVMIRELYRNNLLVATSTDKSVYFLDAFQFNCKSMLNSSPEHISDTAIRKYSQWADCFRFPLYCSKKLSDVLQGKHDPLSVIYPKGDLNFMYQFDKLGDLLGDVYYNMYMKLIALHAQQISSHHNQIRILEVGAGVGYVTRQLLPKLQGIPNVEYWFTDLGKSFVENAKHLFPEYRDMMKFATFDITKNPARQGVVGTFDIVISYNVIHATESIKRSVLNLKTCLGNNGSLYIIESAKNETWATLAWGILDGWWFFKDYDLRPFEPMLEPEKWEKVLKDVGFHSVHTWPFLKNERNHVEKFLFLCSAKSEEEFGFNLHTQGWWENDASRFDPMKKYNEIDSVENCVTGDSVVTFMSKQQVYEELKKIWCEVLGIDNIESQDSFNACGGESLLAIKMMNHVHKRLGYQLEIADTFGYPTLGELATYIANGLGIDDQIQQSVNVTSSQPVAQPGKMFPSHEQTECGLLLMFPGQGAQKISMFQTMKESSAAKAVFEKAKSIVGYDVLEICISQGEEIQEKIKSTEFVQVALLTGCIAKMEQIKIERPELVQKISHVAGLSVGEYAALVYANIISFEDALQLVQCRGKAMEHVVNHSPTGMVSIFGPGSQQLQSFLDKHYPEMSISTYLGDNQHTVVGSNEDCNALLQSLSESCIMESMAIVDVRRMRVAGAFHSLYMENAATIVNPAIEATHFSEPKIPIIMNVNGNVTMSPEDIKELLKEQLVAPVKWKQSILAAYKLGVRKFVEVAPGRVLSSIVKKRISECSNCSVEFIEM